jgi:hypothetical protein
MDKTKGKYKVKTSIKEKYKIGRTIKAVTVER